MRTAKQKAAHCEAVKKIYAKRRKANRCINEGPRTKRHGRPRRGGRCRKCWDKKLASERDAYAATKGA